MSTYALFFATTQHGRKCIKITDTALTREEIILMAQNMIKEGKLRRLLRVEQRVKQSVRLL